MSWIFPNWVEADDVLKEMAGSLGGYVAIEKTHGILLELIKPELIRKVPVEYIERFVLQYTRFRNYIVKEADYNKISEIFYKSGNFDDVAEYLKNKLPPAAAQLFFIMMGVPLNINIHIMNVSVEDLAGLAGDDYEKFLEQIMELSGYDENGEGYCEEYEND